MLFYKHYIEAGNTTVTGAEFNELYNNLSAEEKQVCV